MTPQTVNAVEIAKEIQQAWGAEVSASRGYARGPQSYCYASSYSPCTRAMLYSITSAHMLPPFSEEAMARMERGSEIERDKLIYLSRVGQRCNTPFTVIGQQERFELRDRKGRVAIVGKVDARLRFQNGLKAPFECKAWAAHMVERIDCFEDLFKSKWTLKGAMQLLCYLFGAAEPIGFLLLDRPGIPKIIPVELEPNLDRVEQFLQNAETALDHKEQGTEPDFYSGEDATDFCSSCEWYGGMCNPPIFSGPGAQVLTDPDLLVKIERRHELTPLAKEFTRLDTELKKKLRGVELGLAGEFLIEGKWQKNTRYVFPNKETESSFQVTDPKGSFRLEIHGPSRRNEEAA